MNIKSLKFKAMMGCSSIIIISGLAISFASQQGGLKGMHALQENLMNEKLSGTILAAEQYVENVYGALELEDGELVSSKQELEVKGHHEYVDRVKEDLGMAASLFIKTKDGGYMSISSNVITSEGKRGEGTVLPKDGEAHNALEKNETFVGRISILGEPHYAAYKPIFDKNNQEIGAMSVAMPLVESNKLIEESSGNLIKRNLLVLLAILSLTTLAILLAIRSLMKSLNILSGEITRVSNCDLSKNKDEEFLKIAQSNNELGQIAQEINKLRENLLILISQIFSDSGKLANTAQDLSSISEEVAASSEELSSAIEGIAESASTQALDTESASVSTKLISELMSKSNSELCSLKESFGSIEAEREEGENTLTELTKKTKLAEDAVKDAVDSVSETLSYTDKIEEASLMISDIASQTNLLALNASIEAARAGESGRGFAVVAEEIRKLAEESNAFSSEINTIINSLKKVSKETVASMDNVTLVMNEQSSGVNKTGNNFKFISESIKNSSDKFEELEQIEKEITSKVSNLEDIVEELTAIAEGNATSTEESSASLQEQAITMGEVASASEELTQLSLNLKNAISKFNIE